MKIALSAGHTMTGKGTGAVGFINESKENRVMFDLVKKWLEKDGHTVYTCNVKQGSDYLEQQVALANKTNAEVAVQIHFNSSATTNAAVGTETLYVSNAGKTIAERINTKLSTKFKNRGAKKRTNLYWLNNCKAPTVLIEVCFVSSKADVNIYNANKDQIAKLIAEGIVGRSIASTSNTTTPSTSTNGGSKYANGSYNKKARTTAALNVRTDRSTSSLVVTTIPKGTELTVSYCLNNWFSTYDYKHNGNPCYVCGDYIELI